MMMIGTLSLFFMILVAIRAVASAGKLRSSTINSRALSEINVQTVTTMECSQIHDEPYVGKLTLKYEYRVDTFPGDLLDVPAIEDALVQAVAAWLDTCDDQDRPHYAVELTNSHAVSSDKSCIPRDLTHVCQVIDGSTTILLDTGATEVKKLAYNAIKAALADEEYIGEFAPAVASPSFLESGRDSFVVTASTTGNDGSSRISTTTFIAIASASVAFVLVSIFAYGMFRRIPVNRIKGLSAPDGGKASPGHIGIKPAGNYYDVLDDEQPSLFHLDINGDSPSNTWSVSDITSEGSIRSGLSRGTSTLERIDEETLDEIELYEDEEEDEDTDPAPQRSPDSISHFIANFDAVDRRNTSHDNGPHDAMESIEMSRAKHIDDEAACTMVPVTMSSEEAQRVLDDFLLPFSQVNNDVEASVKFENETQENPVEKVDTKADDDAEEESEELVVTEESAHDDNAKSFEAVKEVDEAIVDNEEDTHSEKLENSLVTNDGDGLIASRMATGEDTKLESKVEDTATPTASEREGSASCDNTKGSKPSADESRYTTNVNSATATEESSTASDDNNSKDEPVASSGDSIAHTTYTTVEKKHGADTSDANQAATNERKVEEVSEKETKEAIERRQSTIDRVVSVEEPIGLAVHDTSFDDSLALSTYTTESDEEVSVSSFLATFLQELSSDKMCVSQCQREYPNSDESAITE